MSLGFGAGGSSRPCGRASEVIWISRGMRSRISADVLVGLTNVESPFGAPSVQESLNDELVHRERSLNFSAAERCKQTKQ